ncbi:MAG: hypothetical protein H5U38_01500 [Calditrichaeota bacterium]|nr:hypothetical protein [Calditrichota bacterium]
MRSACLRRSVARGRGRLPRPGVAPLGTCFALSVVVAVVVFFAACGKRPPEPVAVIARAPQGSEPLPEAVATLSSLGFTVAIVTHHDETALRAALDAAQKVGLKLFVGDPRLLTWDFPLDSALAQAERMAGRLAPHPACAGYWLGTVADTALFRRAATLRQHLASRDRMHKVLVGLTGYGPDQTRRPVRYTLQPLEQFAAIVRPPVIPFDQQGIEGGAPAPDFFANLAAAREAALAARLPWWGTVFEAHGSDDMGPRDNYLRFQAMCLLAHGATGVEYVLDWATLRAWGAARGPLPPAARAVAEINATVAAWSPVLSRTRSVAVYHSDPVPTGGQRVNLQGIVYRIDGDFVTLGLFRGKSRRDQYVMVVNRNYSRGAKPKLFFSRQVKGLQEIAPEGVTRQVVRFAPEESSRALAVLLKAGGGRLFRLVT